MLTLFLTSLTEYLPLVDWNFFLISKLESFFNQKKACWNKTESFASIKPAET